MGHAGNPRAFSTDDKYTNWREYYVYTLPDDEIVAIFDDVTEKKKAEMEQKALQEQLKVVICVGETEEEREEGKAKEVVDRQIEEGLLGIHDVAE